MAILTIAYRNNAYHQVLNNELSLLSFLNSLLKGNDFTGIIEHLTQYHSQNGDTCQINDFELTNASYNAEHSTGRAEISYRIQYFYGCADITREANDHETWKFDIDEAGNTLSLHMPEYEVRSTHDEF
jgi:cytolysin (calcineurin-like family phosphatase)